MNKPIVGQKVHYYKHGDAQKLAGDPPVIGTVTAVHSPWSVDLVYEDENHGVRTLGAVHFLQDEARQSSLPFAVPMPSGG